MHASADDPTSTLSVNLPTTSAVHLKLRPYGSATLSVSTCIAKRQLVGNAPRGGGASQRRLPGIATLTITNALSVIGRLWRGIFKLTGFSSATRRSRDSILSPRFGENLVSASGRGQLARSKF